MQQQDASKLNEEYQRLIRGLQEVTSFFFLKKKFKFSSLFLLLLRSRFIYSGNDCVHLTDVSRVPSVVGKIFWQTLCYLKTCFRFVNSCWNHLLIADEFGSYQEAVPGNIRKAEHFISFLRRFLDFMSKRHAAMRSVASETPLSFLKVFFLFFFLYTDHVDSH